MKLNCKPGDLAVFVRSMAGNEGKIVKVTRLATVDELQQLNMTQRFGSLWWTENLVRTAHGRNLPLATDSFLRPIRDSEQDDETLTLAGLPVDKIKRKEPA
jgi:predicted 2-oxoglutarate/Fe(II)-dependent dioxygenase YbiX